MIEKFAPLPQFGRGVFLFCARFNVNKIMETEKQREKDEVIINNKAEMRRVEMAAGLEKQIERQAWMTVSRKRPLTAAHLERYEQQLLWDEVSRNNEIQWTIEMALRWKEKLNWNLFSRCAHGQAFTAEGIETLAHLWDWKALTANPNVRMTTELVRKYIAKWDWSAMAWRSWEDYDAREFYSQFFERVPRSGFSGSKLEFALHQQEVERLWQKMNEQ